LRSGKVGYFRVCIWTALPVASTILFTDLINLNCNTGSSTITRKTVTEIEIYAIFLVFKVASFTDCSCWFSK
jgi:hypothetical protein